ncbi:MAG TPA: amino acid ABC transporter substrate-binding protein [Stellaceae bacterium]|nr:amino acid ABC transporter substrate-binding protein [Stellaceae bacterium]
MACGINTGNPGFALADSQGHFQGFEIDLCRAVAAAILGDPDKIKFSPLSSQQRFTALQSGEIDVLSRSATWTLTRDAQLGLDFAAVTFYDGQGVMVPAKLGIKSLKELNGASVCILSGSTSELNIADYARANGISFKPIVIEGVDPAVESFFSGRCDAYTTDKSGLAAVRASRAGQPGDYVILPETISKEPISLATRKDDPQFSDIVRWTMYALIEAEERGITAATIDSFKTSTDPGVQRLLGVVPGMGAALGLPETWAYTAIKSVGNYGEIFERNLGPKTPLAMDRGLNALWTKGGLLYAPPIR